MTVFKYALFITLFSGVSVQANEGNYVCSGTIDSVSQGKVGTVAIISNDIYGDNAGRIICSLASERNGVAVTTCQGWLSKLLTAKATGAELKIRYIDNLTCETQYTWNESNTPWTIMD